MRIRFSLAWLKPAQAPVKAFKSSAAFSLVREYIERIGHFLPCETGAYPSLPKDGSVRRLVADKTRSCVWVCERVKKGKAASSEDLAKELQKCMNSGVQVLEVVIGGPDGFTDQALDEMAPSFRWSFGPMTLPHELAAVVATEQIYRALTILHHKPYHSGH
jgi:23S rRNA (pseudouridine1915-N3)-methyltransferase